MSKALKILETQFILILELKINMNYLLKLHEIEVINKKGKIKNRQYLYHIAKMSSNEIISNLYKLIHENNYSFCVLIDKAKKEKVILIEKDFKYFEEEHILIKDQFDKLDIKKIRDKYVAHLDSKRKSLNFYFVEINDLIIHIENSYKILFRSLKKEDVEWGYNNDMLSSLLDDVSNLNEYLEKE